MLYINKRSVSNYYPISSISIKGFFVTASWTCNSIIVLFPGTFKIFMKHFTSLTNQQIPSFIHICLIYQLIWVRRMINYCNWQSSLQSTPGQQLVNCCTSRNYLAPSPLQPQSKGVKLFTCSLLLNCTDRTWLNVAFVKVGKSRTKCHRFSGTIQLPALLHASVQGRRWWGEELHSTHIYNEADYF